MPVAEQLVRLPPSAQWLEQVTTAVSNALAPQPPEVRAAALLAASELAENVLKFGRPTSEAGEGSISLSLAGSELRLVTENGASPERFRSVSGLLERITTCASTELLYVERLNLLLASKVESTGLGLLRVAHEGNFVLRCTYDEPKLTITAVRKLTP
jgi:hypothetical protein